MRKIFFILFLPICYSQLGPTYNEYFLDEIIFQENIYKKKFSQEIVDGRVFKKTKNKNKIYLGKIIKGQKIGKWYDWFSNGIKKENFFYINGKKNGQVTSWDSTGKIIALKYFNNDKKDSIWTYYKNGIKEREENYDNNKLQFLKLGTLIHLPSRLLI